MIQDRVVTLYGTITVAVERRVMDSLEKIKQQTPPGVVILINSNGGSVIPAVKIRSAIASLPMPTEGIAYRCAASSSFMILQHCSWRCARPGAQFMYHAPTLGDMRIDTPGYDEMVRHLHDMFEWELEFLKVRTGQSVDQWRQWSREERLFTAEEALGLGIIDAIYYRVPYL